MATFEFEGINEYAERLQKLSDKAEGMIKRAVWEGARVVTDNVAKQITGLPEREEGFVPDPYQPVTGVTEAEKAGLLSGLGLATMHNSGGFINTKMGFSGYNAVVTKKYPQGQPNAMIARSIESGSSFRKKNPFIRKAVTASKADAEAAMSARFDADTKVYAL